ncbi:MAG: DUF2837 family protein [Bacteroidales bacterium]|nr:DUF2837 family protein [Bacteroidales bacterium]
MIFIYNVIAVGIFTVGVLSSLYAGLLEPELRTTSATLSAIANGFATILLFVFIDPYLSGLTDDVVEGKFSETGFSPNYSRIILTLLKNLAFCFNKFRKKPVFLMRGNLAPQKLREGEPASIPQTIPHSKTFPLTSGIRF